MVSGPETARALYRRLLCLYPRAFRERFGESMGQTFNDLLNERRQEKGRGLLRFVAGYFAETGTGIVREHAISITKGMRMGNITTNPRSAAILGFVLALPAVVLFSLIILRIEPDFGPLEPLLASPDPDQPDVGGSLIAIGTMLLLPVALVVNIRALVRARRAGMSLTAHPVNLVLAVAIFAFMTSIVGAIIADQYPCWMGVPNCD